MTAAAKVVQQTRGKRLRLREAKALDAIIRHERAAQLVAKLTRAIGREIALCPLFQLAHENQFPGEDTAALWSSDGKPMTHLWHAYHDTKVRDFPFPTTMDKEEQLEYLKREDCPHCLEAWRNVELRRDARKVLGSAKNALRTIGRAALKAEDA